MAARQWAGDFDCQVCRRKRLPASEFSNKMVEKRRKDAQAPLKCKECVAKLAEEEREAATKKRAEAASTTGAAEGPGPAAGAGAEGPGALHECAACKVQLPAAAFSRAQLLNKGPGKQRCKPCLTAADADEKAEVDQRRSSALADARAATKKLEREGASILEQVKAAAYECAVEAELVTGLKPMKIGNGKGRGRGSYGSGRGRRGGGSGYGAGRGRGGA